MKFYKLLIAGVFLSLLMISCNGDDDTITIDIRDPQEVYDEDIAEINLFLQTHFYNMDEFQSTPAGEDFKIRFDTIAGANAGRTPLSQQVETRTLRRDEIDMNYYVLKVRQGGGSRTATFVDSTLVTYEGLLLDRSTFDSSSLSVWFDLTSTVDGFGAGISGFNDATSITPNGDGTIKAVNGGIGAMFLPSGLGYFNAAQAGIPAYSPIVFTFQLRRVKVTDHDGDGVLTIDEDLDGDQDVRSPGFRDNTDRDFDQNRNPLYNYLDADDDNDRISTLDEITVFNADGTIQRDANGKRITNRFKDTDGDGIPDYLDARTEN